jgi:thiol-disulfide isomerase/thioredoxin
VLLLTLALIGLPVADTQAADSHIRAISKPFPAHVFKLNDLDDNVVSLEDFKGKTVIINFWATWCPPCRRELPSMQRAYTAYKKSNLIILGINVGENWETIAPFLSPYNIGFPILLDTDSSELTRWKAIGLPTSFVVNGKGMVTHRFTGGRDWDDPIFRKDLESILAGN